MKLSPRVIIAFDAYKDAAAGSHQAQLELDYQLKCLSPRETDQYYRAVSANRQLLARAAEETEWAEINASK